jgi:hypothetical protein
MEHGSVKAQGPIEDVIRAYENSQGIVQGEVVQIRPAAVG